MSATVVEFAVMGSHLSNYFCWLITETSPLSSFTKSLGLFQPFKNCIN